MLSRLSHRARTALRQFLAMWIVPAPEPMRDSQEAVEVMDDIASARARNDCKAIGRAAVRLREVRNEGLRREIAMRRANFGRSV